MHALPLILGGVDEPTKVAMCKIDLKTGVTTPVPDAVRDLVSHDGAQVPATRLTRLFGFTLPDGKPTQVSLPADAHPWMDLRLSSDNQRLLRLTMAECSRSIMSMAQRNLLEVIFAAAWWPDGKWLAAGRGRTRPHASDGSKRSQAAPDFRPSELAKSLTT